MTDEELDALVNRLKKGAIQTAQDLDNRDIDDAATAITTLRAQLEVTQDKLEIERALTDGAHRRARGAEKEAHDCGAEREAWKARADRAEAELAALSDPLVVDMNMLNGRIAKPCVNGILHIYAGELVSLEQLQAALAAQIEADAGILQAVADNWDCGHSDSRYCRCAELAEQWGIAADEIRNQPHDRTALDAVRRATKVEAWREAADELKGQGYYTADRHIIALINTQ